MTKWTEKTADKAYCAAASFTAGSAAGQRCKLLVLTDAGDTAPTVATDALGTQADTNRCLYLPSAHLMKKHYLAVGTAFDNLTDDLVSDMVADMKS